MRSVMASAGAARRIARRFARRRAGRLRLGDGFPGSRRRRTLSYDGSRTSRPHVPGARLSAVPAGRDVGSGSCGDGELQTRRAARDADGGDVAQEGEFAAAVRAGEGFEGGKLRQGFAELAEHRADRQPGLAGGGAQEPVVADAGQSLGQDVEQPAPDEFVRMEGQHAGLACCAVGPGEADIAFGIVAEQALGGESAAPDVAGEVTQGGLALADGLELDVVGVGSRKITSASGALPDGAFA